MTKVQKINLTATFWLLVLCSLLGWKIALNLKARQDAAQYHNAPGCEARPLPAGIGSACRLVPGTITSKWKHSYKGSQEFWLHVTEQDKTETECRVSPECYDLLQKGQRVQAEVWKGSRTRLLYSGLVFETGDNPFVRIVVTTRQAGAYLLCFALFAPCVVAIWWDARRTALTESVKTATGKSWIRQYFFGK